MPTQSLSRKPLEVRNSTSIDDSPIKPIRKPITTASPQTNVDIVLNSESDGDANGKDKDDDEDAKENGVEEVAASRTRLRRLRDVPASKPQEEEGDKDDDEGEDKEESKEDAPESPEQATRRSTRKIRPPPKKSQISKKSSPPARTTRSSAPRAAKASVKNYEESEDEDGDDSSETDEEEEDDDDDDDFDDGKRRTRRNVPARSTRSGSGASKKAVKPVVEKNREDPQRVSTRIREKKSDSRFAYDDDEDAFERMLDEGIETSPKKKPKKAPMIGEDGQVIPRAPKVIPASHMWCSVCLKEISKPPTTPIRQCPRCLFSTHKSCAKASWHCGECKNHPEDVDLILTYRIPEDRKVKDGITATGGTRINTTAVVEGWELLVKFEGMSYRELAWVGARWLDGVSKGKLTAFIKKTEGPLLEDQVVDPDWKVISRILDIDEEDGQVLVKWKKQPLEKSTWNDFDDLGAIPENLLAEYNYRIKVNSIASAQKVEKNLEKYRSRKFVELKEQPKHIVGGELKGYQMEGLNWMLYNLHSNTNSILADDMGLGKTVQVAAFLNHVYNDITLFPSLIVVPNATIANWMRELAKWAPKLVCIEYRGSEPQRNIIEKYLMFNPRIDKDNRKRRAVGCHVVVTTYEMVTLNPAVFKGIPWQIGVVDEAHRLKNDEAKLFLYLGEISMAYKICLTGTPLQNNIRELFNLMNYINPSAFADSEQLSKEYKELNSELVSQLHEKLRPHFLRRTKEEVLKDVLPSKKEVFVPVTMTSLQRELYKAALMKNFDLLASLKGATTKSQVAKKSLSNLFVELRKILNHPYLIDGVEPVEEDVAPSVVHQRLIESSAKLSLLHRLLVKLKANGHRVLIFSQWTRMLDIIEDYVRGEGISYGRLDGSCDADEKSKAMDEFNDPKSENFLFLLSTRAGGQGINLATADTIIIYDCDFNPHMDMQAMARCHRIGQTKPVLVLKMFVKQSAEEKMLEMAAKKLILDHVIVEAMDQKIESNDLESVLRFGAQALFEEDENALNAITYSDNDLVELMERNEVPALQEASSSVSNKVFGFTYAWKKSETNMTESEMPQSPGHEDSDGEGDAEGDDGKNAVGENFWNDLLKKRIEEARAERMKVQPLGKGQRIRKTRTTQNADNAELEELLGESTPNSTRKLGGKKRKDLDDSLYMSSPHVTDPFSENSSSAGGKLDLSLSSPSPKKKKHDIFMSSSSPFQREEKMKKYFPTRDDPEKTKMDGRTPPLRRSPRSPYKFADRVSEKKLKPSPLSAKYTSNDEDAKKSSKLSFTQRTLNGTNLSERPKPMTPKDTNVEISSSSSSENRKRKSMDSVKEIDTSRKEKETTKAKKKRSSSDNLSLLLSSDDEFEPTLEKRVVETSRKTVHVSKVGEGNSSYVKVNAGSSRSKDKTPKVLAPGKDNRPRVSVMDFWIASRY
ncbi:hypothetical protein HDU97_000501 [Phlyctochytrium planicorne]|nr:hypothetical protein HDU97_000501 [Phlyctochytrium planicorne]